MHVLLIVLFIVFATFSAEIKLKKDAFVYGKTVTIADIADNPQDLTREILNTVVGRAAPAGYNVKFDRKQVSISLASNKSIEVVPAISGAESVSIKTAARVVVSQQISDIVKRKITAQMPWRKDQARIDMGRMADTIMVPAGDVSIVAELAENCNFRNSQTVQILISKDGEVIRKFPVVARIRIFENVCVAKNRINRHERLTAENIRIEKREITEMKRKVFDIADSLDGKTVDRTILAGTIITDDFIKLPLLVKKGEPIKIVSTINEAVVAVDGEALRDGILGANIPVRNMLTGKRINAYVIGESTVSLQRSNGGLL
jgi:flagella basal body P-ring formation protein FlgA